MKATKREGWKGEKGGGRENTYPLVYSLPRCMLQLVVGQSRPEAIISVRVSRTPKQIVEPWLAAHWPKAVIRNGIAVVKMRCSSLGCCQFCLSWAEPHVMIANEPTLGIAILGASFKAKYPCISLINKHVFVIFLVVLISSCLLKESQIMTMRKNYHFGQMYGRLIFMGITNKGIFLKGSSENLRNQIR